MDQASEMLDQLLADPEKLSAAVNAVSGMLGVDKEKPEGQSAAAPLLPAMSQKQSEAAALLKALKPFLSQERRERADKAARLISLAGLATQFKDLL